MPYLLDAHCHTVASGHAYSTIKEYAEEAKAKGLQLIAFTDHSDAMPGGANFLHFLNLPNIPEEIGGVELLTGVELNILDESGTVDLRNGYLKKLDVVIASLHQPCFAPKSIDENTCAVVNAAKNPYINVLGHLCDARYPIHIKEVVSAARDENTIIELNSASLSPKSSRFGGEASLILLLDECKKQGLPILLGSDSHIYTSIGDFSYAEQLLDRIAFPDELILNTSVRYFKDTLRTKR